MFIKRPATNSTSEHNRMLTPYPKSSSGFFKSLLLNGLLALFISGMMIFFLIMVLPDLNESQNHLTDPQTQHIIAPMQGPTPLSPPSPTTPPNP